jgi:hypothetical protein
MKASTHVLSYLAQFVLELENFQTKFVDTIKRHIFYSVTFFFRRPCFLSDDVEKYTRAGEVTDDSMAHAHFTLDT